MKKYLSIMLSFIIVFTMLPGLSYAAEDESSDQVEQEAIDYDNQEIFEMESLDDAFVEDTSDISTDEVTEIGDLETEEMGEDMELGLPDDEEFVEPEGAVLDADENLDETEELNLDEPEDDEENEEGYEVSDELTDEDGEVGEEGDGSEEELGASGATLIVPSRATVGVGKTTQITPRFKGKGAKSYQMKVQDTKICTAKWTKVNGKCVLNVTGKKAGSTYITFKLKGGFLGLITLDKRNIRVDVPQLSASPSSITVTKGGIKKFVFSYANCVENVYLRWSAVNPNRFSASWGKWNKKSIALTVKGKSVGNAFINVSLVNSKTGEVYATKKVTAIVTTPPSVKLSSSKIDVMAGKSTILKVSYANLNERSYYTVGSNNNKAYSLKWGSISGQTRNLIVTGKNKGSGKVTVYLKSAANNAVLASATATVNVSAAPKITAASTSLKVKTGLSTQVKVSASGVSGKYCFSCSPGKTSLVSTSWGNWVNNSNTLTVRGLNAGTQKLTLYLKNTSGTILDSTVVTVTVEAAAKPGIKLSSSSLSLNEGRAAQITATVSNMPSGQKTAQVSWTDSAVCKCSISWSGSNPVITVTAKKSGSANVTITIKNKSDNKQLAQATASIKVVTVDKINNVSYSFSNGQVTNAMGYPSQKVCDYMFAGQYSKAVYNKFKSDYERGGGGNCFGMSLTSDLMYTPNGIYASSFGSGKTVPQHLSWSNKNSSWGLSSGEWIQALQISQVARICEKHYGCSITSLVNAIRHDVDNGSATTVLFWWDGYGHAVVAYGIERVSSTRDRVLIYENNSPLRTQYIYLDKDSSGNITNWSYSYSYGKTLQKSNTTLGYVSYDNSMQLWSKHGSIKQKGLLNNEADYNLATVNSNDFSIYDVEDNLVAEIEDGTLQTDREDIELVHKVNYVEDGDNYTSASFVYLPVDVYNFENQDNEMDEFSVELSNLELSTRVETTGNEVALCADDSSDFASAILSAGAGEQYSITLGSSREGEPEEMVWEGVGTGDTVSIMLENGNLEMLNLENANLTISDENDGQTVDQVYTIFASAGENGTITPEGEDPVWEGENQEYLITADAGYEIEDVFVDGESVGAVGSYTFKDVHENHEIAATFKESKNPIDLSKLAIDELSDATYTGKEITPKITIKYGDYTLEEGKDYFVSYSDNIDIGTASVTIQGIGDYTGIVKKTFNIHQLANPVIEETKPVVDLPAVKISKPKAAKKAVVVKWKKVSKKNQKKISKIQIQYSTDKKFRTNVRTTTAKKTAVSKKISKLKKGKRYYFRIRSYKKINGRVHVSKWSSVKNTKAK